MKILIRSETGYVEIPLQSIQEVTVSRTGQFFPSSTAQALLDSNTAIGLLRLVDFENPFNPGGVPAALVTGNLTVTFADSGGNQETREFVIYNDRLIQDTKFSDAFYYVGPTFKTFIQSL